MRTTDETPLTQFYVIQGKHDEQTIPAQEYQKQYKFKKKPTGLFQEKRYYQMDTQTERGHRGMNLQQYALART